MLKEQHRASCILPPFSGYFPGSWRPDFPDIPSNQSPDKVKLSCYVLIQKYVSVKEVVSGQDVAAEEVLGEFLLTWTDLLNLSSWI